MITEHVAADNPATQAVSLLCENISCNLVNGVLSNPPYVVPSGKRLVIESISGYFSLPIGQKAIVCYSVSDAQQSYSFCPRILLSAWTIIPGVYR